MRRRKSQSSARWQSSGGEPMSARTSSTRLLLADVLIGPQSEFRYRSWDMENSVAALIYTYTLRQY